MSEPPTPLSSGPRSLGPATSSPTSPGPPYAPELGNSSSSEAPVPSSKDLGALTSLHIASEVDAVGFLANTAGCLGTRARLMEWYDAGRTLEAILSTVVLGSWGGGWSTRCREMFRPFPQPHNNPGEQLLLMDTAFTGVETGLAARCLPGVTALRSVAGEGTHGASWKGLPRRG